MKAKITRIVATSRASVKIKDSFYTFEYTEERSIPDTEDFNIEEERKDLWDTCNNEVDNQLEEVANL